MKPGKYNRIELLTGFLMGIFFGYGFEMAAVFVYHLICRWRGVPSIPIPWWGAVPIPLLVGVSMAKAIASLHLEDY